MDIKLTKCQKDVMEVIWANNGRIMIQDIISGVKKRSGKEWKNSTLSTYLKQLVAKGLLDYQRINMFSYYWPTVSREEYAELVQEQVKEEWFGRSAKAFGTAFFKKVKMSDEQRASILKKIDELED